jgi:hypothetical protein
MRQPVCISTKVTLSNIVVCELCSSVRLFSFSPYYARTQKAIRSVCLLLIHAVYSARLPDEKLKYKKRSRSFPVPNLYPDEQALLTSCMNHLVHELTISIQVNFVELFAFGSSVHGWVHGAI